jgi:hypothetical protein
MVQLVEKLYHLATYKYICIFFLKIGNMIACYIKKKMSACKGWSTQVHHTRKGDTNYDSTNVPYANPPLHLQNLQQPC